MNALVIDVGSGTTKAGYAGEDTPKAYFPSVHTPLCWTDALSRQNALIGLHAVRPTQQFFQGAAYLHKVFSKHDMDLLDF